MDVTSRELEQQVRRGDDQAARELVRWLERRGFGENAAWRWHAANVATQAATWGEARSQAQLSLALFGLFLERYGIDTVASGRVCPRRVAGLEHLSARCVCGPDGWFDHGRIFGRGSDAPVVFTSQPYTAPAGRRWSALGRFCARGGLTVEVRPEHDSWHNPGFSRLIVISRAPAVHERTRSATRLAATV